jgi:hypothetical protein
LITALALVSLALLGGCGNSRTPVPNTSLPAAPQGLQTLRFTGAGVTFQAPRNWKIFSEAAPLVTVLSSGQAVVAVWRFPRTQALPTDPVLLSRAQALLISTARAHDPTLQVIRSKAIRVNGARALELDAFERIAGQPRRVRSTHVFAYGAELVLEEYAPASMFHAVDHSVFSPLKRSLLVYQAATPAAG